MERKMKIQRPPKRLINAGEPLLSLTDVLNRILVETADLITGALREQLVTLRDLVWQEYSRTREAKNASIR